MSEFYLRSIDRRWKKEIALANEKIVFLSPYLTSNTANLVLQNALPEITRVYTVFSFWNFVSGSSSIKTLKQLRNKGFQLFHLEKLHAKVLIVDNSFASLGSQNLTFGGTKNREATAAILNVEQITRLNELVKYWLTDARPISDEMIAEVEELIKPLQKKIKPVLEETSYIEEEFWYKLKLEEMRKRTSRTRRTLNRFRGTAGHWSIDEETARLFIRKSAWWLRHPSGIAARAPRHQYNVYGSNPDWRIDFGANTFLVGRAIQRCLNTIDDALEKMSVGETVSLEEVHDLMFYNITGAVANYKGYEYEGYYSAIDSDRDMVFGTQSIDIKDFINCMMEVTYFESVFIESDDFV